MSTSAMIQTTELGAEFWNDSCSPTELQEAVANGATGATSNPVIVSGLVKNDPKSWNPLIDGLCREYRTATESEIAWMAIHEIAKQSAKVLEPIYQKTRGKKGYLSVQVNPTFYRDSKRMLEHGKELASLAPNIAIKAPCTPAGIDAMEGLTAAGINVNATVSFTLSQMVAAAEAIERGLDTAKRNGVDLSKMSPCVTLMVGRLDDHLQRLMTKGSVAIDPGYLHWAGVATFKKAYEVFKKRSFRATPLVAAYRHHLHWSELIGEGVILTIPYTWWKQFNASDITPSRRISTPVDPRILDRLTHLFPDFRKAYEEGGLKPAEFTGFGATTHTLNQFLTGYQELLAAVRERMLLT